ncbi:MAG: PilZ domain-containing protein [Nitrospirales bacterium]
MVSSAELQATRANERMTRSYKVLLTTGRETGEGHLCDLSVKGCAIESPVRVSVGQALELRILLAETQSLQVRRAVVRWVKDWQFGVEFQDNRLHARVHQVVHAWKHDPWKLAR